MLTAASHVEAHVEDAVLTAPELPFDHAEFRRTAGNPERSLGGMLTEVWLVSVSWETPATTADTLIFRVPSDLIGRALYAPRFWSSIRTRWH